jgi:tetratricopeptide (TPR) repeat protein
VPAETGDKKKDEQIYEIRKATEDMKPILVFFNKPKDLLAFGKKARKDPQVEACEDFNKDLWKRWVITELAKEFVCVRVNIRKAEPNLLRRYRVARAPVIQILDFNMKPLYFTASARLSHSSLARIMDRTRKKVEIMVKRLAKKNDDSPLVKQAKIRAAVIEQRELYDKGLEYLEKQRWVQAEKKFNETIAIDQDSDWKKKAKVGILEIKAGKDYYEAEKLYKLRRFPECKKLLEQILSKYKEAKFFCGLAKDKLAQVKKKVKTKGKK